MSTNKMYFAKLSNNNIMLEIQHVLYNKAYFTVVGLQPVLRRARVRLVNGLETNILQVSPVNYVYKHIPPNRDSAE